MRSVLPHAIGGYMKGLELSKKFFYEYGKPMLDEFPDLLPYIAVGLVGSGSECYGYDDELSTDHDFSPEFCIFLPDESVVDRRSAFLLERAYLKLPKEFMGYKRAIPDAVGEPRHGVIRISDFLINKTGTMDGNLSTRDYLSIPEHYLLEVINGEIFFDNYGLITKIRENLYQFPNDVRTKKIAGNLLVMAQSGQYNYDRCIKRGETASAQICLFEFSKSAMNVFFLLERRYSPYYKWSFRALREISEEYFDIACILEFLISNENQKELVEKKKEYIDKICCIVSQKLIEQNLTCSRSSDMERQAYEINDYIKDAEIRNMNILCAI